MEKNVFSEFNHNMGRTASILTVIVFVFLYVSCSILSASAFVYSPVASDIYAMPLDFVFEVENKTAGVTNYELTGYLLSPLLDTAYADSDDTFMSIETDYGGDYDTFYRTYYQEGLSVVDNRALTIYSFLVNEWEYYDYSEQTFNLRASDAVISMGNEYAHLYTQPDTDAYFNAFVSFDYKIPGDTTVHHFEDGVNSTNFVALIPTASALGVEVGDLVYVYNYFAEVYYNGDTGLEGDAYYPRLGISALSLSEKQSNSRLFMENHERLISGSGTPPAIDNVWLLQSVTSFFNFEIFPGFSLGGVMGILFAITVLIAVLKFVAGG